MDTARGYLSTAELKNLSALELSAEDAKAAIAKAETIIDGYIGHHARSYPTLSGVAQSGTVNNLTLSTEDINSYATKGADFLKGLYVEIVAGTAQGAASSISGSTTDGAVTFADKFDAAPDATSVYHIYQVGKFPRGSEVKTVTLSGGSTIYYWAIPRALKEAVAAQTEYMQEMGDSFFDGEDSLMKSERRGKYQYTRHDSAAGGKGLIAPKARQALAGTGIINRTGKIIMDGSI